MAKNKSVKSKKNSSPSPTIALNRKARHDYSIEKTFESGIVLEGWEVKSIRQGHANIADSYVVIRKGEAWLLNALITPLLSASTHVKADPLRTRKLLLHAKELRHLVELRDRSGYTIIALKLYWQRNHVKVEVGVAKGKKLYDKREDDKNRDWERQKGRLLRQKN